MSNEFVMTDKARRNLKIFTIISFLGTLLISLFLILLTKKLIGPSLLLLSVSFLVHLAQWDKIKNYKNKEV